MSIQLVRDGLEYYVRAMSKIQQIEAAMQELTTDELRQVHEWLENFLEDQLEMTDEFKAGIAESKKLFATGIKPRVRQP